jgi:hypothetical protein
VKTSNLAHSFTTSALALVTARQYLLPITGKHVLAFPEHGIDALGTTALLLSQTCRGPQDWDIEAP